MSSELQQKTKVLFFITKSNWGGAQRYVFDLATALPDSYEPVVTLGGEGELKAHLEAANVRVVNIPGLQRDISFRAELAAGLAIFRIIRAEQPAVLHVNSSKAGGLGALLGRLAFVPCIIFTAHGWAFNEDRPGWQRALIKGLHWLTVLFSHRTIAVSEAIKRQLDWPLAPRKMTVVHNGRAPIDFCSKETARSQLIKAAPALVAYQNDLWSGTIAELHPIKRHDVMIEAVARLRERGHALRHIIIGSGQQEAKLRALVQERGLAEHVFFAGAIHEAAALLPAFDIFTLTSRSEALGYTAVEAAQAGLPIVASRVGGLPEIITDGVNGLLVEKEDVDALTKTLGHLLKDAALRDRLAKAAKERGKHFTLERMVNDTIAVYSASMLRASK